MIVTASSGGDVWPLLEEVRSHGSLLRGFASHLTVDHAVVREVLSSPDFRSGNPMDGVGLLARVAGATEPHITHPIQAPSMLAVEPPDHTRYRKLVTRVFTVKAITRLRERTEEIAADLLDELEATSRTGAPVDLIERYCSLLPVAVISEILGVPAEQQPRVLELGTAAAPSLDFGLGWSEYRSVYAGLRDFDAWLDEHLAALRRQPGDDLLSQLISARDEENALSEVELKATAGLVLAAGFETTVNLLGNGIRLLHDHPEQRAHLREDVDLWPSAVDEVLRFDPPVLLTGRVTPDGATVAGVDIAPGGFVTTVLAGANRDPEVFADPARFDVARANAGDHVSFSAGRHYCLGAALARMEGEVGLRAFFDRFPDVELTPGARRRTTRILRGWERLPARIG